MSNTNLPNVRKPKGFEEYLSSYGEHFDHYAASTYTGFKLIKYLGQEKFNKLYQFGKLVCNHQFPSSNWYLIPDNEYIKGNTL